MDTRCLNTWAIFTASSRAINRELDQLTPQWLYLLHYHTGLIKSLNFNAVFCLFYLSFKPLFPVFTFPLVFHKYFITELTLLLNPNILWLCYPPSPNLSHPAGIFCFLRAKFLSSTVDLIFLKFS